MNLAAEAGHSALHARTGRSTLQAATQATLQSLMGSTVVQGQRLTSASSTADTVVNGSEGLRIEAGRSSLELDSSTGAGHIVGPSLTLASSGSLDVNALGVRMSSSQSIRRLGVKVCGEDPKILFCKILHDNASETTVATSDTNPS